MHLAAPHGREVTTDHLCPPFHTRNIRVHGAAAVGFLEVLYQFDIWWVWAYDWVAASLVAFGNEPLTQALLAHTL